MFELLFCVTVMAHAEKKTFLTCKIQIQTLSKTHVNVCIRFRISWIHGNSGNNTYIKP